MEKENNGSASRVQMWQWFCELVFGSAGSLFSLPYLRLAHDVGICVHRSGLLSSHQNQLDLRECKKVWRGSSGFTVYQPASAKSWECSRMIKLPKRVGSVGGLILETMEVVALSQIDDADFKGIFLNPESVREIRNSSFIVSVKHSVISIS